MAETAALREHHRITIQGQQIRPHYRLYPKHRVYLLSDILFCAQCVEHMPEGTQDEAYGKMRASSNDQGRFRYSR